MSEIGSGSSCETRTLLVVDDDDVFRARLVRALNVRGFVATGAASYNEALAMARVESPECALVDLKLPGPSGLEVGTRSEGARSDDDHRGAHRLREHRDRRAEREAGGVRLPDEAGGRGPDSWPRSTPQAGDGSAALSGRAVAGARRVGAHPARARRLRRERLAGRAAARHPPPIAAAQAVEVPGARKPLGLQTPTVTSRRARARPTARSALKYQ